MELFAMILFQDKQDGYSFFILQYLIVFIDKIFFIVYNEKFERIAKNIIELTRKIIFLSLGLIM